jgi:two-component system sensor kinase FixL
MTPNAGVASEDSAPATLQEAESKWRASDARWRAIIDSAVDAIIVIDAKGIIESFNTAAERLFGYSAGDVIGKSVNVLMPRPYSQEHDRYLANYLAGAPPKIIGIGREVTARRKNGEEFPARLAVGEASVDGVIHFTGIIHDLTDRKAMEKRLLEQGGLAKLGEMAAVVAHEVRNALAGVCGVVQVISSRLPKDSREAVAAGEALTRLDALSKMVNDMLLFAHLPEPEHRLVDLGQLLRSIVDFAGHDPLFHDTPISLTGGAVPIVGDEELLRTVLLNLLTNSAQAMSGGGMIRVAIESAGRTCRIAIADDGPGVPPEVRGRLFTPFFTTKARGTGLGLATARRIIDAHGGSIQVECPSGGGTRVVIELPTERSLRVPA